MKRLCCMILVFAAVGAPVEAQSLADVAQREAERRSTVPPGGRVYTDRDLTRLPYRPAPAVPAPAAVPQDAARNDTPAVPSGSAAQPASAKPGSAESQPEAPKAREKRDEKHWRERAALIRGRLDRLRAETAAIEGRVATLRSDLESAPAPRATGLANELRLANGDLTRFQSELQQIEQEWTTFEERARRAKVPSNWLQ